MSGCYECGIDGNEGVPTVARGLCAQHLACLANMEAWQEATDE